MNKDEKQDRISERSRSTGWSVANAYALYCFVYSTVAYAYNCTALYCVWCGG